MAAANKFLQQTGDYTEGLEFVAQCFDTTMTGDVYGGNAEGEPSCDSTAGHVAASGVRATIREVRACDAARVTV